MPRAEETFLADLKAASTKVTVHLVTGTPIKGIIAAFDTHMVLLRNSYDLEEQAVSKHSISRIEPFHAKGRRGPMRTHSKPENPTMAPAAGKAPVIILRKKRRLPET